MRTRIMNQLHVVARVPVAASPSNGSSSSSGKRFKKRDPIAVAAKKLKKQGFSDSTIDDRCNGRGD
jgi:hypothetical protein